MMPADYAITMEQTKMQLWALPVLATWALM